MRRYISFVSFVRWFAVIRKIARQYHFDLSDAQFPQLRDRQASSSSQAGVNYFDYMCSPITSVGINRRIELQEWEEEAIEDETPRSYVSRRN